LLELVHRSRSDGRNLAPLPSATGMVNAVPVWVEEYSGDKFERQAIISESLL
jgi:hypothetical protein